MQCPEKYEEAVFQASHASDVVELMGKADDVSEAFGRIVDWMAAGSVIAIIMLTAVGTSKATNPEYYVWLRLKDDGPEGPET